jgi:hypothetical protein
MLDNKIFKHTISEYIIYIALLLQQWLHEFTSLLNDMYIVCLFVKIRRKGNGYKVPPYYALIVYICNAQ